jgi:uncharacterized protein
VAKILLLALVFFFVWWFLKGYKKRVERGSRGAVSRTEDMVRCAQCGVHLPKSESLIGADAFYCSADHRSARERSR